MVMHRLVLVDWLKILAAHLIVWHHLCFYSPMADHLPSMLEGWRHFMVSDARKAVQVFLVIGGFLSVRGLLQGGQSSIWDSLRRRYLRLVPIYLVALLLVTLMVALARASLPHADWLPISPTWREWFSHALLINGWLDHEAISSGVWYVAMDMQLFVVWTLVAATSRRFWPHQWLTAAAWIVWALAAVSLFVFNRAPEWNEWALYFFGAYGLGLLAGLACERPRFAPMFWGLCLVAVAALMVDYRDRILLALITAIGLQWWGMRWREHATQGGHSESLGATLRGWRSVLAESSYALFLIHFGIIVLASAFWEESSSRSATHALVLCVLTWVASAYAGLWLHRGIERPLNAWLGPRAKRSPLMATGTPKV